MLQCKGMFVNAWHVDDGLVFDKSKKSYTGSIPNSKGYVGYPLAIAGERKLRSFYTDRSGSSSGEKPCVFYDRGVIIERKDDRLRFLRKIRDAAPVTKRDRISAEIATFERATRSVPGWYPTSIWACDGNFLYVSGPGIFDTETIHASDIIIEGKSVAKHLSVYFSDKLGAANAESAVRAMLGSMSFSKIVPLDNRKPTAGDLYECASFGLVMSQVRGFVPEGYTFSDLGVEYGAVLSGLQNLYSGGVKLHELRVNFARFVADNEANVIVAEKIAPYVACKVTPFIVDSTGSKLNNLAFATLINAKGVSYTGQGNYTVVRLGDDMIQLEIDPSAIDTMFRFKGLANKLAMRILYNCQTYSFAVSESSSWATSLYAEWRGLPGIIGSLSFGI